MKIVSENYKRKQGKGHASLLMLNFKILLYCVRKKKPVWTVLIVDIIQCEKLLSDINLYIYNTYSTVAVLNLFYTTLIRFLRFNSVVFILEIHFIIIL